MLRLLLLASVTTTASPAAATTASLLASVTTTTTTTTVVAVGTHATAVVLATGLAKGVKVAVALVGTAHARSVAANVVEKARLGVGRSLAVWLVGRRRSGPRNGSGVRLVLGLPNVGDLGRLSWRRGHNGVLVCLTLLPERVVALAKVELGVGYSRRLGLGLPAMVVVRLLWPLAAVDGRM